MFLLIHCEQILQDIVIVNQFVCDPSSIYRLEEIMNIVGHAPSIRYNSNMVAHKNFFL